MSEPVTRAERRVWLLPTLGHWTIQDERIDFRSEAYAVRHGGTEVWIDPLPLADGLLPPDGGLTAIVLTGAFHQRSAWSLRRRLGAPVLAPRGAANLDEAADREYEDSDRLPGGLRAIEAPGPRSPHFALIAEADGARILFCGDLLMRDGDGPFAFVPDEHHDDPARARVSLQRLAGERPRHLCPAHGAPSLGDAERRIREALASDRGG